MTDLAGKRALVTGGGSGAGEALALAFAAAGAEVVISGRRAGALQAVAARHPAIRAVQADVTDETSVRAMFAEAGPCDIVIANAGAAESAPMGRTRAARPIEPSSIKCSPTHSSAHSLPRAIQRAFTR